MLSDQPHSLIYLIILYNRFYFVVPSIRNHRKVQSSGSPPIFASFGDELVIPHPLHKA